MGKFKEGRYIAIYEDSNNCKRDVWGKVIESKETDGHTTYTLLRADGTTCKADDRHREVRDYDWYCAHLYSEACGWQESINITEKILREVLGDDFRKALEIADSCGDRLEPFKYNDTVVFFPVVEKHFYSEKYEQGTVIGVKYPEYYENAEYYLKPGINGPICIPVYTIKTKNGNRDITGNDWNFSGYFIGTQDEFVRLLVNNIKVGLNQIQTAEAIREELYNEIKDVPGEDTLHMRHPIEIRDPFGDQKTM